MRLCWLLLLMGSVLYGAGDDEEALFLRRIADFWQEGEYQIAKSQIEEFIVQYPESTFTDALCAALGDLALREKNYSNALNYYSRIQTPELADRIFLSRMQCLYELQWYATLAEECEAYLEKGPHLHATYFLAISLYHQCLNAAKEPEILTQLVERAKPYFEILSQSELSDEVAQGFAHLCCILKDFSKASQIYLRLAKNNPAMEEEMLFQAGLIQSEYDKVTAIQTFEKIAAMGQKRAKEAAYNKLVLSFDTGQHEQLKKIQLNDLPPERIGLAHLFLGRSFLNLKDYESAVKELKTYIEDASASETLRAALISLLDAAYQCNDLNSLDQAIAKLIETYPGDTELPKAYFSRAQVLKKMQNIPEAHTVLEQLLAQFPQFQQKPQVLFELLHLDYKSRAWESCNQQARAFLNQFPEHELAPFAWRYFISSSAEMTAMKPELKERLICDLEFFLKQNFTDTEKSDWQFLLAKSYFETGKHEKAISALKDLKTPNAKLLLALCHRDGYGDQKQFCELAELALTEGTTLIDGGALHSALFNAYLGLYDMDKAAEHLYAAFEAQADIQIENLLWLADVYYNRCETDFTMAARAAQLLESLTCKTAIQNPKNDAFLGAPDSKCKAAIQNPKNDAFLGAPDSKCKAALHLEPLICKLAKVYSILGRVDEEIVLLESLENRSQEAQLLLAEGYAHKGLIAKATELFDAILAASHSLRSATSASACLQGSRLKLTGEDPDVVKIATQLKNLSIQKTFVNEPLHLEAALDYVALQAKGDLGKKIVLLNKTKADFERTDDLLSKDYHEARARMPEKNRVYEGYMQLVDAEILAAQAGLDPEQKNELAAKSKEILLKIVREPTALSLLERARMLLTNLE